MNESEKTLVEQFPKLKDRLAAAQNIANRKNSRASRQRVKEEKVRKQKK